MPKNVLIFLSGIATTYVLNVAGAFYLGRKHPEALDQAVTFYKQ